MDKPEELQRQLIALFPSLEEELKNDDELNFGYEPPITYHRIWLAFNPVAKKCLKDSSTKKQKAFCDIVNLMVSAGGDKENAISTCLLEHASQIGIKKIIKPYLSNEAKLELR